MPDHSELENFPAEHQQNPRRWSRFVARNGYLFVGNILVSTAIVAAIILVGALTPKEIEDRKALQREGSVTYTNNVQIGGRRDATVFYTFTFNGRSYSGKAFLPHEYSEKVQNYSKDGNFPVLFIPENPSINHPYDWSGNGPIPILFYILIIILIVQWSSLVRFVLRNF